MVSWIWTPATPVEIFFIEHETVEEWHPAYPVSLSDLVWETVFKWCWINSWVLTVCCFPPVYISNLGMVWEWFLSVEQLFCGHFNSWNSKILNLTFLMHQLCAHLTLVEPGTNDPFRHVFIFDCLKPKWKLQILMAIIETLKLTEYSWNTHRKQCGYLLKQRTNRNRIFTCGSS